MVAKVKPGHCGGKLYCGRFHLDADRWTEVPEAMVSWVKLRASFGEVMILDKMPGNDSSKEGAGTPPAFSAKPGRPSKAVRK